MGAKMVTILQKEYNVLKRQGDELAYILGAYSEYMKSLKEIMTKNDKTRNVQSMTEQIILNSGYVTCINNSIKEFLEKEPSE